MLYLAIEKGIIERNVLQDINYKQFAYKAKDAQVLPTQKKNVYESSTISKMISILWR